MTVRRTAWSAVGFACALGLVVLLHRRAASEVLHARDELHALEAVRVADSALDEAVLGVMAGTVRHFDRLATEVRALGAAQASVSASAAGQGADAWVAQELERLAKDARQKQDRVEQLKTSIALLWTSSRQLPLALAALAQQGFEPREALVRLGVEVARFGVSSPKEIDARFGAAVANLESTPAPADEATRAMLRTVLGHARALLQHRRHVDERVRAVLGSPARDRVAAVRIDFERRERRAVVVAVAAQTATVGLVVLGLAALFDLLRALRAARRPVSGRVVPSR